MTITVTATELEDFDSVEVIEVLVAAGDQVEKDQSLLTLESDKAMMEIPAPEAGVVKSVQVAEGDKVKQGDVLVELEAHAPATNDSAQSTDAEVAIEEDDNKTDAVTESENENEKADTDPVEGSKPDTDEQVITVTATELEDFDSVEVIEVLVAAGDQVEKDQSLLTLESDKAMMEIPAPEAGVVKSVQVAEGDKVKQGDGLAIIVPGIAGHKESSAEEVESEAESSSMDISESERVTNTAIKDSARNSETFKPDSGYASPGVRKYARELGVSISEVKPSADQGRVTKKDVQTHVQGLVKKVADGLDLIQTPKLPDFSQFGEIDSEPLSNIRKVSAKHLRSAWNSVPHVTQFDDVDITELELARKQLKPEVEKLEAKLTILPFVMKALIKSLQKFPHFNSSLNAEATKWIVKKYYHLGIAVDTPNGLVVPVFKDVDQLKIPQLAVQLKEISEKAREGKLSAKDMRGGCMTITSLGGIGGRHFTPIVNFPEVAILGVSRSFTKLQLIEGEVSERIILPLSLSYDHRAIDGAEAAAFITDLKNRLGDIWSLII